MTHSLKALVRLLLMTEFLLTKRLLVSLTDELAAQNFEYFSLKFSLTLSDEPLNPKTPFAVLTDRLLSLTEEANESYVSYSALQSAD